MKNTAQKIGTGHWLFMGWEIEKIDGHWNMKPEGAAFWTDAAATLTEAKRMVEGWAA